MAAVVKKALDAEARKEDVSFIYDGVEFTVPNPKNWPLAVVRAQENGKMIGAIETLLGNLQFALFDPDGKRTMGDLEGLLTEMFKAIDVDPKG